MKKLVLLLPFLLLVACVDSDYERTVCESATQGLRNQPEINNDCRQELWRARFQSAHRTAQHYRDMPR